MTRRSTSFASLLLVLVLAACTGTDSPSVEPAPTTRPTPIDTDESELPVILVTTSVLGEVVGSIVGDDAAVEVLMPPGADPHDFEPSARQAASLRDATLVVANGLQLEIGLLGALESARADGVVVVEVGDLIDPLPYGAASHAHEEDDHAPDEDDHGDHDPHFWHDPLRMAAAVPGLAEALVAAAPQLDSNELRQRADDLVADLIELDAEIAAILAEVPASRRYLITNHDTFGYFADRYDFEVIGSVIPGGDTLAQPSPGALAALAGEIEAHGLPAIFAENVVGSSLADALASEAAIDVEVVTLYTDSLGTPGSGAETYLGMLRTNARLIADALG